MTSRDFCYWLQGFFELRKNENQIIDAEQSKIIQNHLAMVFKHEIDPSMGDKEHQATLDNLHNPSKTTNILFRC